MICPQMLTSQQAHCARHGTEFRFSGSINLDEWRDRRRKGEELDERKAEPHPCFRGKIGNTSKRLEEGEEEEQRGQQLFF